MTPSISSADHAAALLANADDQIDSALWLIAGERYSQAMSALHNAIELAFKAELTKIHPFLITDGGKNGYENLKGLLKSSFEAHPRAARLEIKDIDYARAIAGRTITFGEAMDRVREIYPEVQKWNRALSDLQAARNHTIHVGKSACSPSDCARLIATVAFPFLNEFFLLSRGTDLKATIPPTVYREIEVAMRFCDSEWAKENKRFDSALKTVRYAMRYCTVSFPSPTDKDGYGLSEYDRESEIADSLKRRLYSPWRGSAIIEVACEICGTAYAFAQVELFENEEEEDDFRARPALGLACAVCGLYISRADGPLAELHYGIVSEEDIKQTAKWDGYI